MKKDSRECSPGRLQPASVRNRIPRGLGSRLADALRSIGKVGDELDE